MIINTTKIVGFISSHYVRIAIRWYDRLETLGYRNHYIVCTDTESYDFMRNQSIPYRVEAEVTVHTDDTNVTLDRLGNHFHRLVGLPVKGFTGYSTAIGVRIHVWDRDFAYRGKVDPSVCPKSNWVSMPFVTVLTRGQMAHAKLSMYDLWDSHCPNDYTNITQNPHREGF